MKNIKGIGNTFPICEKHHIPKSYVYYYSRLGRTQYGCPECKNDRSRERRKKYGRNDKKNRHQGDVIELLKKRTRDATKKLVKNGTITKIQVCEICCSRPAKEKHHINYLDPFNVLFLCPECHRKLHHGSIVNCKLKEVKTNE